MDTTRFPTTFYNIDNFYDFLFAFLQKAFWKRMYSTMKAFAPNGSKFFPFRLDILLEGRQNIFDRVAFPESLSYLSKYFHWLRLNSANFFDAGSIIDCLL